MYDCKVTYIQLHEVSKKSNTKHIKDDNLELELYLKSLVDLNLKLEWDAAIIHVYIPIKSDGDSQQRPGEGELFFRTISFSLY